MDFRALPSGDFTLANLSAPGWLAGSTEDLARVSLSISKGQIAEAARGPVIDMGGAMVLPCFTDMHTHLDKGHIWPRAPNPDGSFMGALATVTADRSANWRESDVRARMGFSLRCAYAHGTRAIRTHLDSIPPQDDISFGVFREIRADWAGRIELQAACLIGIEGVSYDGPYRHTVDLVAGAGGILGCVTYPLPDLADRLRAFLRLAKERGLAADFHVDETGDASVATLKMIAEMVLETGFSAPVTVGHCCSLAVQPEAEAMATLDLVAKAGMAVVSLPMCNMYLQDRSPGLRTPRWRGVTLVHEMRARGIAVGFASDNSRDPFYAYGDMDMIEVMREATRIAHLDHSPDWSRAFLETPARVCGFALPSLAAGAPADLVIVHARNWNELFARPQADRIVLRDGRAINRTLPDYAELDELMGP